MDGPHSFKTVEAAIERAPDGEKNIKGKPWKLEGKVTYHSEQPLDSERESQRFKIRR